MGELAVALGVDAGAWAGACSAADAEPDAVESWGLAEEPELVAELLDALDELPPLDA